MIWASDFFEHAAWTAFLNHLHRGQVAKWLFSYLAVYFVKQTVWALIWRVNTQRTKMLLKLVTNENEWWSLKRRWNGAFTRWNCHIWQLVWLLFLQQCHVNTKYQSWCFYNIAYIQPNAPSLPLFGQIEPQTWYWLSLCCYVGFKYFSKTSMLITAAIIWSKYSKKNSNIDLLSFIYTQWLWKKA